MSYTDKNYKHSDITEKIIGEAYKVRHALEHGFVEKVYENALLKKLREINFEVEQQYPIAVYFENQLMGDFCADLFVENKVIVELKAVEKLNSVHEVQLVNYLKATGIEVGLLLNFGQKLKIRRKVSSAFHNLHNDSASKETE